MNVDERSRDRMLDDRLLLLVNELGLMDVRLCPDQR